MNIAGSQPQAAARAHGSGDQRLVFSSNAFGPDLTEKDRLAAWDRAHAATNCTAGIDWLQDRAHRACLEFVALEDAVVGHIDYMFKPVRNGRRVTPRETGRDLVIGLLCEAPARARFGGEVIVAPAGGMVFCSSERPLELLDGEGRITGGTLTLPHKVLSDRIGHLDDLLGRPFDLSNPSVGLLARYIDMVVTTQTDHRPAALSEHIRHTLVDLAAIALDATGDHARRAWERGLRAGRLAAIKADIRADIGNRDISARAVARRHGITPRYLHMLFEQEDGTFGEFVTSERLARAHRQLTDPRRGGLRIADLAFEVGFADISTFNRQFKRRYGMTPTEARAAAALPASPERQVRRQWSNS